MAGSSYDEYKKERSQYEKKKVGLHSGKICVAAGLFLFLFTLWMLPYRVRNIHQLRGDEIEAADDYSPRKAYQIDKLEVLEAKTETDGKIYAIARFWDSNQKDWIVLLTPGNDKQMEDKLKSFERSQKDGDELTVSGCFLMRKVEVLSVAADAFYSVYGLEYANEDKSNMPAWNTEYLCTVNDNYTMRTLFQRGIPLYGFVTSLCSMLYGVVSLIRYRQRKGA